MTTFAASYEAAMNAARERFAPLTAALMRDLGLDTEPVVEQTGGMVMCLGIYWPDGAYAWFSDYWWYQDELALGLYEAPGENEDGAENYAMPNAPWWVEAELVKSIDKVDEGTQAQADAVSKWATPWIRMHGAAHGWERR